MPTSLLLCVCFVCIMLRRNFSLESTFRGSSLLSFTFVCGAELPTACGSCVEGAATDCLDCRFLSEGGFDDDTVMLARPGVWLCTVACAECLG